MLDAKLPTPTAPEPLSPAEHEKALALLEARSRRLRPAPDATTEPATGAAMPVVHSTFND